MVSQQLAHANRLFDRIEAVGVGVERHVVTERFADKGNDGLGSSFRPNGMNVGGHEHQAANFDLQRLAIVFGHVPFDELQRLLHRFFTVFGRLVNRHVGVVNITNQFADWFAGNAAQHVQYGKLDRGQWRANRNAVVPEVKSVNENLLQQEIQVARVFADKEWLQIIEENREEGL